MIKIKNLVILIALYAVIVSGANENVDLKTRENVSADMLDSCISLYDNGFFESSLELLETIIFTDTASDTSRLVDVRKYLAYNLIMLNRTSEAENQFLAIFGLKPDFKLNEFMVLPEIYTVY
ncbi:MAG: hypothetical protein ABIA63_05025 [bacterium]